jgi:acyl-CoA thioester hydrolase
MRTANTSANDYVDISVRVRYAETDQMGVAYYANHLVWFELGRTELFRQRGYAYRELEEQEGYFLIVAEVRCRYHSPARYDEVLTVRTRVKEARTRVVAFTYEILAEDGRKVATGETLHVVTDRQGRPRTLPEKYRQALLTPAESLPAG